jgi:site-specific recombinase XerD
MTSSFIPNSTYSHSIYPIPESSDNSLMLDQFQAWLNACHVAPNTARAYLSRLQTFEVYVRKVRKENPSASIDECSVRYIAECRQNSSASESLRAFSVALKSYCKFRHMPHPQIHIDIEAKPVRLLSPAQQQRLVEILNDNCSDRERAMVALMLLLGLRTGEIIRANLNDLRFERGALLMSIRNDHGLVDRILPVSPLARRTLASWIAQRRNIHSADDALFVTGSGERLHPNTVRWCVNKVGNMLGIVLAPRTLRNTFIGNLANKFQDLGAVASLAGLQTKVRVAQFVQPIPGGKEGGTACP